METSGREAGETSVSFQCLNCLISTTSWTPRRRLISTTCVDVQQLQTPSHGKRKVGKRKRKCHKRSPSLITLTLPKIIHQTRRRQIDFSATANGSPDITESGDSSPISQSGPLTICQAESPRSSVQTQRTTTYPTPLTESPKQSFCSNMDDTEDVISQYGTPIPLAPKIIHRFYEPIMLLEALRESAREHLPIPSQSAHVNVEDLKQLYQAFVYKLAHICDREKGGKTVTAIMILDMSNVPTDEPEYTYVFAVNQATSEHLAHTASFLHTVLQKVALAPPATDTEGRTAAERELRQIVLRFNRPRMRFYLNSLRERASVCLDYCLMSESDENNKVREVLNDLLYSEDLEIRNMTPEAECKSLNISMYPDISPRLTIARRPKMQNRFSQNRRHILRQTSERHLPRPRRRRPQRHSGLHRHVLLVRICPHGYAHSRLSHLGALLFSCPGQMAAALPKESPHRCRSVG